MWSLLLSGASSFVSTYINYVKIGLVALVLCGCVYVGYSFEHSRFMAYQERVEAAGKAQEAKNEQILKEQQVTTERITNDYKNSIARIHTYYGGLHDSSGSSVSSPSNTIVRINGFTTDPVFAEQCAYTTAQLVSLQEWVREQVGIK